LDPFLGSGTTALVARELGRDWLGVELNPVYVRLARRRLGLADADETQGTAEELAA
jgi:site-specific DNA-methyltransferase (adenine-specific)